MRNLLRKRLEDLRVVHGLATSPGNCDTAYLHGLANGIILAMAIMDGTSPDYIKEVPK